MDRIAKSIQVQPGPSTDHEPRKELLDALQLAVVFAKNSFYLVAFAPHHNEVRHYKLDRISQVDVQLRKFPKPLDFNLEQHFADSWSIYRGRADTKPFTVRVRFTAEVSRYVQEKRWHTSQKLSPNETARSSPSFNSQRPKRSKPGC